MAIVTITNYDAVLGGTGLHSDTSNIAGAEAVRNIVSLTQAEYDSLSVLDDNTAYMIVE